MTSKTAHKTSGCVGERCQHQQTSVQHIGLYRCINCYTTCLMCPLPLWLIVRTLCYVSVWGQSKEPFSMTKISPASLSVNDSNYSCVAVKTRVIGKKKVPQELKSINVHCVYRQCQSSTFWSTSKCKMSKVVVFFKFYILWMDWTVGALPHSR